MYRFADLARLVSIPVFAAAFILIVLSFLKESGITSSFWLLRFRIRSPFGRRYPADIETDSPDSHQPARKNFWAPLREIIVNRHVKRVFTDIETDSSDSHQPARKNFWEPLREIIVNRHVQLVFMIIVAVGATRLFLLLLGYLGYVLRNNQSPGITNSLQMIWDKWDSGHYLSIARNWYRNFGEERWFIVFFPLYPLITRLFSLVFKDYFSSGLLVSTVSLVVACIYLYKLVELDHPPDVARRSIKWVLIFPYSFFLGLVFTEGLFLALSVLAFYQMRRQRWITAGIFGLLAAMTRNIGVLLLIPLAIEYTVATGLFDKLRNGRYAEILSTSWKVSAAVILMLLGTFLYLGINRWVTGDWFRFLTYQRDHWGQNFGFFADNIKNQAVMAFTWKPAERLCIWIPQLSLLVVALVCIFSSVRSMRLSYIAYMFALLFVTFSATWLLSGPRYTTSMFPIYIFLARISKDRLADNVLTFFSLSMLCLYTLAYTWGMYVM